MPKVDDALIDYANAFPIIFFALGAIGAIVYIVYTMSKKKNGNGVAVCKCPLGDQVWIKFMVNQENHAKSCDEKLLSSLHDTKNILQVEAGMIEMIKSMDRQIDDQTATIKEMSSAMTILISSLRERRDG